ncbi:hypothetical protein MMC18_007979 [Xylographa bjoerkii]|nr:hypothetical protein [Xylographa bjoerkii]
MDAYEEKNVSHEHGDFKKLAVTNVDSLSGDANDPPTQQTYYKPKRPVLTVIYVSFSIFILFLNYFLAQYDKFVLSYFQNDVVNSLNLTSTDYGVLSGYATGIAYALLAIPVAFVADYADARVWVLSVAALWWSLCVLFQGLSHNFWQILLARIGMGIGQAPVEALSISIISDLVEPRWLFLSESLFYVGVYLGEAVSGQIATAFDATGTPWNKAMIAIGIAGIVLAVLTRIVLREPIRRVSVMAPVQSSDPSIFVAGSQPNRKVAHAKRQFLASVSQVIRMRSFWLLALSSGARQFSGNVFGWYMPGYLTSLYPSEPELLSNYGIIVGAVGSVAVVLGGLICTSAGKYRALMPLYITAIGGMISAAFVVVMVFSLDLAGGNQDRGVQILYGVMSAAYITAELWLGAYASLLAMLLPARTKTFCLAIYTSTIILIYSSAPQIIGLALQNYDVNSEAYIEKTRDILAILIPVGYGVAGVGLLCCVSKVKADIAGNMVEVGHVTRLRKGTFIGFWLVFGALTIALFVTSLVIASLVG